MSARTVRPVAIAAFAIVLAGSVCPPAHAGSHLWRINEVFSSSDGSVQFIELKECCGSEIENGLSGKWIRSATTGAEFIFPGQIEGNTAHRHLLLATESYTTLPGAVEPDYIIAPSFFDLDTDTLTYWLYPKATLTIAPGQLPVDGVHSLAQDGSVAVNSPTNFRGDVGSVTTPGCASADIDNDGNIGFADLLAVLNGWGPCFACAADVDEDGQIGFSDVLAVLTNWGPC